MEIRLMRRADLGKDFFETLSALYKDGIDAAHREQAPAIFDRNNVNPDCHLWVAIDDDKRVVGTIKLIVDWKFKGKAGHIEDMAVRAYMQRRGIGRKLVETAVEYAKQALCYKVRLDCAEENKDFYRACGFHEHEHEMRMDLEYKNAA